MSRPTIVDTGPIVAFVDRREPRHDRARRMFAQTIGLLRTCEAVISESCHILRSVRGGPKAVMDLATGGVFKIDFDLDLEIAAVSALMDRYANVPMSLADACLVRMAELYLTARILTLDSDFRIYRRNGKDALDAVLPDP